MMPARRVHLLVALGLTGGLLGCASPVPDVTALAPGDTAELFNGEDLSGWEVLTGGFYDRAGEVAVADGAIVLGAGDDLTGVRWAGKVLRGDYVLRVQAKRMEGGDFFCGLTFPVGREYVTLILGGWGGTVVGLSNVDYSSAVENETTTVIEFEPDRWYDIEVQVTSQRIRVWLDGAVEPTIDLATAGKHFDVWFEQEPARPLGITTYATKGAIRAVSIHRLSEDDQAEPQ